MNVCRPAQLAFRFLADFLFRTDKLTFPKAIVLKSTSPRFRVRMADSAFQIAGASSVKTACAVCEVIRSFLRCFLSCLYCSSASKEVRLRSMERSERRMHVCESGHSRTVISNTDGTPNRLLAPLVILGMCLFGLSPCASAQSSDAQAVALVQNAVAAVNGSQTVNDLTLSGSATRTGGSGTVSGALVIRANSAHQSRIDFSVSSGIVTELRDSSTAIPSGSRIDSAGVIHPVALQNCWSDVGWFSPVVSMFFTVSDPTVVFRYVGQETFQGASVNHVVAKRQVANQPKAAKVLIRQLSATDLFFDATTGLPVAMRFNLYPDSSAQTSTPVTVEFGNYQQLPSGQNLPFHVTRNEAGTVTDIQITSAVVNSGILSSTFSN